MAHEVRVKCRRDGEKFTGATYLFDFDAEEMKELGTFSDLNFEQLLRSLSSRLREYPDATAALMREEAGRFGYMKYEETMVKLLREDLDRAISILCPPRRVVMIGDKVETSATSRVHVRAGYDTLADAFGDVIYCKMRRGGGVECPCCGRWGLVSCDKNQNGYFRCKVGCDCPILGKAYPMEHGGWWGIDIRVLLHETTSKRFYLPRLWNVSGPWVSHEALKKKYETYLKEKADVRN